MEFRLRQFPGRFCPDCGKLHEECACEHGTLPKLSPPKFAVGEVIWRARQTDGPMKILDRVPLIEHNVDCGDEWDSGHSAHCNETREWRYECEWRPGHLITFDEKEIVRRQDAVAYRTWYWWWGGGGKPVFEEVQKAVPDVTREEVAAVIAKLEEAKAAKILARKAEAAFGFEIDIRKEMRE